MTWKVQIRHMLLDKELWGYVDDSEILAEDATEARKAEFKKNSQKALTAIIMATSSSQIYVVQSCETPDDAWRKLQGHFEKGTLASKLHLRKKYFRMEMEEGADVETHLRNMKEVTERLAAMGSPVAEEDQVMTLLGSLPPSYGPLVTTLGAQLDKVTWLDVEHALMDEQFRNHGKKTSSRDTALVGARVKSFGRPRKKNIKCYSCGKPGHFKYECPNRKADDGQKQGHSAKTAKEETEDMEVAFHAPAGKTEAGQKTTWIIDSGASCHMTWDLSIMYDYKAFEEPDAVYLGDGYSVKALGVGKVLE